MPLSEEPVLPGVQDAFALSSELQESLRELARNAIGAPAKRARALLLLASGLPTPHVANRLGVNTATIKYWRARFESGGMKFLQDGRRRKSTEAGVSEAAGG